MFPRQAIGSVVGLGGFAGAVGGMMIAKLVGYVAADDRQLHDGADDRLAPRT